jgi:glutathione S-transferase
MYTLYSAPMAIAMAPQAVLEQLGQPYDLKMVDVYSGAPPDWYRKLNPYGRVPTLVDGDFVLFEAAAICMHLCDRHPEAGLAPEPGTAERGWFYQWLLFLASAVHPASKQINYPHRCSAEEAHRAAVLDAGAKICAEMYGRLDRALDPGPYLLGDRFSAADLYLATLASWRADLEDKTARSFGAFPRLEDHLARMTVETGFGKVRAQHEAAWQEAS